MKKLILLLTLVTISFSADKWEYLLGVYEVQYEGEPKFQFDFFSILAVKGVMLCEVVSIT